LKSTETKLRIAVCGYNDAFQQFRLVEEH